MRKLPLMIVAVALVALVGACGSNDNGGVVGGQSSAAFNDADVAFAQGMIPHHEQAVEMAKLADQRAESPKVKDLAGRIEAAQGPEISTMRGWLDDWAKPIEPSGGAMGGMGGMGMMSEQDMGALAASSGTAFDQMFLTMMRAHHEGAVTMANDELTKGTFPDAKKLAQSIVTAQRAEIEEMNGLLAS